MDNKQSSDEFKSQALKAYEIARKYGTKEQICFYCDCSEERLAYDLTRSFGLPVKMAYKYEKQKALQDLGSLFMCGAIKVLKTEELALREEFDQWIWKRDEDTDLVIWELDDDAYHADLGMAVLYASRKFVERNPTREKAEEDLIPVDQQLLNAATRNKIYGGL